MRRTEHSRLKRLLEFFPCLDLSVDFMRARLLSSSLDGGVMSYDLENRCKIVNYPPFTKVGNFLWYIIIIIVMMMMMNLRFFSNPSLDS